MNRTGRSAHWLPHVVVAATLLTRFENCAAAVDSWTHIPTDVGSSSSANMRGTGVNLTIVPRDSAYVDATTHQIVKMKDRSMLVWYSDDDDFGPVDPNVKHSGGWLFTPPVDGPLTDQTWKESSFVPYGPLDFGYGTFCSGMAHLGNGDLMTVGGTIELENGSDTCAVFHQGAKESYAARTTMGVRRWYASGTELPDGKILISSGSLYKFLRVYDGTIAKGVDAAGRQTDHFRRCGVAHTPTPSWDLPLVDCFYPATTAPTFARGEASAIMASGEEFFYGGMDGAGNPVASTYVLAGFRNDQQPDYRYSWKQLTDVEDPVVHALPRNVVYHNLICVPLSAELRTSLNTTSKEILLLVGGSGTIRNLTAAPAPTSDIWWADYDLDNKQAK